LKVGDKVCLLSKSVGDSKTGCYLFDYQAEGLPIHLLKIEESSYHGTTVYHCGDEEDMIECSDEGWLFLKEDLAYSGEPDKKEMLQIFKEYEAAKDATKNRH